ncbi:CPBP family intramembrane glutamic endopeptidase [Endozoicomonas sp. GU-1]|uniref:CPBP family intramembrane glutamic endopeptidase n=1 Tax=Endozoicomonas sp. GU-1 TaxID=3009078 RepID=UPI0022B52895|nr:CPBP family intramembrane glutamic endopeptidase [Endozoicomonas sp. GU-1]WBA82178.1 CPBP family intramembrane metalloprotease [Endozoicomonas sp. GU-1]WBA85118.1 CPBP family intramembrane metalloprotease [Endozoicomonas sp. GU-1]
MDFISSNLSPLISSLAPAVNSSVKAFAGSRSVEVLQDQVKRIFLGTGLGLAQTPLELLLARPVLMVESKLTGRTDFNPFEEGYIEKMSTKEIFKNAFIEEALFRVVCPRLIKLNLPFGTGYIPEIISAFLFGVAHLCTPKPSFTHIFMATIAGFKFNNIYKSHGLLSATIAHAAHNLITVKLHCYTKNRDRLEQMKLTLNRNETRLKQMKLTLNDRKHAVKQTKINSNSIKSENCLKLRSGRVIKRSSLAGINSMKLAVSHIEK